jgi:hypothetical protein
MPIHLSDEPSTTEIKGLNFKVEYDRGETGIWSATLRHPRMGSYTKHEYTPSRAREACRRMVAESFEMFMERGAQRHAHEVTGGTMT